MLTREQIYQKLTATFRELFDDETIVLTDATTAADIDGWDSFNNLNMIAAAEQVFNIHVSAHEFESLTCVGDLVKLIEQRGR